MRRRWFERCCSLLWSRWPPRSARAHSSRLKRWRKNGSRRASRRWSTATWPIGSLCRSLSSVESRSSRGRAAGSTVGTCRPPFWSAGTTTVSTWRARSGMTISPETSSRPRDRSIASNCTSAATPGTQPPAPSGACCGCSRCRRSAHGRGAAASAKRPGKSPSSRRRSSRASRSPAARSRAAATASRPLSRSTTSRT